ARRAGARPLPPAVSTDPCMQSGCSRHDGNPRGRGCYTAGMSFAATALTGSKPEQYAQLLQQARALLHGERDRIANAANLSALVYHALPDLNWVGFYFFDGTELV